MGSLREIKDRIASVRSTLKITSAMKLVASSKLRRSQKAIETMLPYKQALEDILEALQPAPQAASGYDGGSPEEIKDSPAGGRTLIIGISSNSSLCGAFNTNAVKAALAAASECGEVEMVGIGRKMSEALKKAGHPQSDDLSALVAKPDYMESSAFAQEVMDRFEAGEFSCVKLVYNHFVSSSRQVPVTEVWLCAAPVAQEQGRTEPAAGNEDYIFEPSASRISEGLRPRVLKLKFHAALLDSAASEHAARTIAMQTASDNAEDLLSELTLEYNKGRQQKITDELLDIVGGSIE